MRRCVQGREPADQVRDVALENLAGLLARLAQFQSVELVFDLIGSDGADEVLEDGDGVALRPFREPILAGVAKPVDDIAPVGARTDETP